MDWDKRLALVLAALLAATFLLVVVVRADEDPQVDISVGGLALLGTENEVHVEPLARIGVRWKIAGEERALRARVLADLTALPGEGISVRSPETWRTLEMSGALSYKPSREVAAAFYCEAGFASRLPRGPGIEKPRTSAPLWSACGVLFEAKRGWLQVGAGPDERLGHGWTFAGSVSGSVRIASVGKSKRAGMDLIVSAILGLEEASGTGQRTNVIRAGVGIGWR